MTNFIGRCHSTAHIYVCRYMNKITLLAFQQFFPCCLSMEAPGRLHQKIIRFVLFAAFRLIHVRIVWSLERTYTG